MKLPTEADRYLKPLVVVLIVLWCGPEVFAVAELTTLLELLGVSLFLFAFGVSFRALALSIVDCVGRALVPVEFRPLIKMSAGLGAVLVGARLVVYNGLILVILCVAPVISQLLSGA
ncbi:MAG: hypothetical protein ABI640_14675 [Gammaproteobacteria bacterium]